MLSSKRKKATRVLCLLMALLMMAGISTVSASAATKSATHYYCCRAHSNSNDMYVKLSADFSGKTAKSVWFSGSYTHWPNGVSYGSTGKGYGYARGTYNIYSGLVTQWVSLTFTSITSTIYIYN